MTNTEYMALVGEWMALKVALERDNPLDSGFDIHCGREFEDGRPAIYNGRQLQMVQTLNCNGWSICPECASKRNEARLMEADQNAERRRKVDRAARMWKKIAAGYAEHADAFKVTP